MGVGSWGDELGNGSFVEILGSLGDGSWGDESGGMGVLSGIMGVFWGLVVWGMKIRDLGMRGIFVETKIFY